jgi:hypothetical protein
MKQDVKPFPNELYMILRFGDPCQHRATGSIAVYGGHQP